MTTDNKKKWQTIIDREHLMTNPEGLPGVRPKIQPGRPGCIRLRDLGQETEAYPRIRCRV